MYIAVVGINWDWCVIFEFPKPIGLATSPLYRIIHMAELPLMCFGVTIPC